MQYTTNEGTQGICPIGSHIPTDAEWDTLANFLGSATAGTQLKSGGSSGLNIPHSGLRSSSGGYFLNLTLASYLWSSSESGSDVWYHSLFPASTTLGRATNGKNAGFSVRCMKD